MIRGSGRMTAEATSEATLPLVSILLATCRLDMLAGAVRMMSGQTYRPRELVVPLHGWRRTELPEAARQALADAGATVLEFDAAQLLPEVLTAGAEAAQGSIIAKIDDDIYGPGYLEEAVQAIVAGKGDVAGKSERYVHPAATRELLLWRPGSSGQEQNYVMGGTVTFRRELARSPGFGRAIPEMPAFLERCSAMGYGFTPLPDATSSSAAMMADIGIPGIRTTTCFGGRASSSVAGSARTRPSFSP
jgi:hypothetical protein